MSSLTFGKCIRRVSVLFLIVWSSVACQNTKQELIGEWSVDHESLAQDRELLKIAPPAGALVLEWKRNMTSEWSFSFHRDASIEMMVNGAQYEGRYQITREVGNTLYIRSELRKVPVNQLDTLLGITQEVSDVEIKRFSIRILGEQGTLKLDKLAPLKLRRQPQSV